MNTNRQSIFASFSGRLYVRHAKVFPGKCFGELLSYNLHRKQKLLNSLHFCRPSVSARLLLTPVFALNYVYRNPGLFIFPVIHLSGSCTGYLPVKRQLHIRLIHKDTADDLKTVYKVISKPVFCFCNNSQLVFLGKNNLE
jgi:hypothetical protein